MKTLTLRIWICLIGASALLLACTSQSAKNVEVSYPSIIEVMGEDNVFKYEHLISVCAKYNIPKSSIYKWKDHMIVFDVISDRSIKKMQDDYIAKFPDTEIKVYKEPFYVFDRSNCESTTIAEKWSHTIMTANLVQDPVMQKEYMEYHATQFEQWPEVSYGFCKADFQQLLMFRNGRQLMLIISIPSGKSLDELDPKTTEDNPRVDEWNAIMGKYQEGIEGSAPSEKWVLFESIRDVSPRKTEPGYPIVR